MEASVLYSGERRLRRSLTTFCVRSPIKTASSELRSIVTLSAPAGGRLPELGPFSFTGSPPATKQHAHQKEPTSIRGKP